MPTWSETPLPDMLRTLDDTVTLQKAQQIEALFKGFYPEINFVLNWNDNTANAYARLDQGKRYVFMLGGLVRHKSIGWQGLALVYAHEVGHHVQNQLGILPKVNQLQRQVSKTEANQLSVRVELQADCFAGVWANQANQTKQILEPGDLEEALNAASQIGDDRLQSQSKGYVVPDSFTHGSSAQRVRWFNRGVQSGSLKQCDTFSAQSI